MNDILETIFTTPKLGDTSIEKVRKTIDEGYVFVDDTDSQ